MRWFCSKCLDSKHQVMDEDDAHFTALMANARVTMASDIKLSRKRSLDLHSLSANLFSRRNTEEVQDNIKWIVFFAALGVDDFGHIEVTFLIGWLKAFLEEQKRTKSCDTQLEAQMKEICFILCKQYGESTITMGRQVDKAEIVPYFAQIPSEQLIELSKLITIYSHVRIKVDQLFFALDIDRKGYLVLSDIEEWVSTEPYFQNQQNKLQCAKIMMKLIAKDHPTGLPDVVSRDQLLTFFKRFSLSAMDDLMKHAINQFVVMNRLGSLWFKLNNVVIRQDVMDLLNNGSVIKFESPTDIKRVKIAMVMQQSTNPFLRKNEFMNAFKLCSRSDIDSISAFLLPQHETRDLLWKVFRAVQKGDKNTVSISEFNEWLESDEAVTATVRRRICEFLAEMRGEGMKDISFSTFLRHFRDVDVKQLAQSTRRLSSSFNIRKRIVNMFSFLDADANGNIDKAELLEWVKNEDYFAHKKDANAVAIAIIDRIDLDKNGTIELDEMIEYFKNWSIDAIDTQTENLKRRRESKVYISDFYRAVDLHNHGFVDEDDIIDWVQHEKYFEHDKRPERRASLIFKRMKNLDVTDKEGESSSDENSKSIVSKDRFCSYFSKMPLVELKKMTSGLITKGNVRRTIMKLFAVLDADKKGYLIRQDLDSWITQEPYFQVLQASTRDNVTQNMFNSMEKDDDGHIIFVHFSYFFKDFEVEDLEMVARKIFDDNSVEFTARRYSFSLSDFKRQLYRRSSVQKSFIK